jgi:S1-C subfamily serine protease
MSVQHYIVDLLIIFFAISAIFRGRELGFVRQFCSAIGFFGGLFIGALLQPHTIKLAHTALSKGLVTAVTTLGCAFLLLGLGEYLGNYLKANIFGSIIGIASLLLVVWLSAPAVSSLPSLGLQTAVTDSHIIRGLNAILPSSPNIIARLGKLVDPNGFPQVFTGTEPAPTTATPPTAAGIAVAVQKDQASVVKIEGEGCGGIVDGSGFVISSDLVDTNAHVIAGIEHPTVLDANGRHAAVPIWFDPNLDFAVLRVSDLAAAPLHLTNTTVDPGTPGAVLGYPGGGSFNADTAAVIDHFIASGRNIYDQASTDRDVYSVNADIIPGNSGGPLVTIDGTVIGIVFAESTTYAHTGYALTMPQINKEIIQAKMSDQPVSTNQCAE